MGIIFILAGTIASYYRHIYTRRNKLRNVIMLRQAMLSTSSRFSRVGCDASIVHKPKLGRKKLGQRIKARHWAAVQKLAWYE